MRLLLGLLLAGACGSLVEPASASSPLAPRPRAALLSDLPLRFAANTRVSVVFSSYSKAVRSAATDLTANLLLPTSWFWGNVSGVNYLTDVLQQHLPRYCGACWAFATTSSLSDRLKIARGAAAGPDVLLSPQALVSCHGGGSCEGGDPAAALEFIANSSLPDSSCAPYLAKDGVCTPAAVCSACEPGRDGAPFLPGTCKAVAPPALWTVAAYGPVTDGWLKDSPSNALAIKAEVYARGPVACAIDGAWTGGRHGTTDSPPLLVLSA